MLHGGNGSCISVLRWKKREKRPEAAAPAAGSTVVFGPCLAGRHGCVCALCSEYRGERGEGFCREGDPVRFRLEWVRAQRRGPFIPRRPQVISPIGMLAELLSLAVPKASKPRKALNTSLEIGVCPSWSLRGTSEPF